MILVIIVQVSVLHLGVDEAPGDRSLLAPAEVDLPMERVAASIQGEPVPDLPLQTILGDRFPARSQSALNLTDADGLRLREE